MANTGGAPGGPSSPMRIPSPPLRRFHSAFTSGEAQFVQSPGQLPPSSIENSPSPLIAGWTPNRTPASQAGSSTYSTGGRGRRNNTTGQQRTVRRVASRFFNAPNSPDMGLNREWSLFEQVMQNEGQLRAREGSSLQRRPSRNTMFVPAGQTLETIASGSSTPGSFQSPEGQALSAPSYESTPAERAMSPEDNASEYDSDDSQDSTHSNARNTDIPAKSPRWLQLPTITPLHKNILKCAVAYFLGSLFTYNSTLSQLVTSWTTNDGLPSQSGHMVATV